MSAILLESPTPPLFTFHQDVAETGSRPEKLNSTGECRWQRTRNNNRSFDNT